jgi:hypothetical protein
MNSRRTIKEAVQEVTFVVVRSKRTRKATIRAVPTRIGPPSPKKRRISKTTTAKKRLVHSGEDKDARGLGSNQLSNEKFISDCGGGDWLPSSSPSTANAPRKVSAPALHIIRLTFYLRLGQR